PQIPRAFAPVLQETRPARSPNAALQRVFTHDSPPWLPGGRAISWRPLTLRPRLAASLPFSAFAYQDRVEMVAHNRRDWRLWTNVRGGAHRPPSEASSARPGGTSDLEIAQDDPPDHQHVAVAQIGLLDPATVDERAVRAAIVEYPRARGSRHE